jgi:hypothetical protein
MAKEIYKSGNYIVTVDADDNSRLFPIGKTVYDEYNSVFRLTEGLIEDDQLVISYADSTNWVDDSASAYTEATLRTFLRENTGFSPASGGSGAAWGGITGTLSTQTDLQSELDDKQDTLVSATNIKTINGSSVLGSGDLAISGGGGSAGGLQTPNPGTMFNWPTSPAITGGSFQNNTMVVDEILYTQYIPMSTFTTASFKIDVQTAQTGLGRIMVYDNNHPTASDKRPGNLLYSSTDLDMSTTGIKTATTAFTFNAGEIYWLAFQANCNVTVRGLKKDVLIPVGCFSSNVITILRTFGRAYSLGAPNPGQPNTFDQGPWAAVLIQL